tara:strand:+ start:316 stop:714 length:399 start_codon:yes stop_codon:yes gene_type:complete
MKKTPIFLLILAMQLTVASAADPEPNESKPELPSTGINLPRPAGGWINVEAENVRLVVRFFDEDKEPTPPDVSSGFVRLRYPGKGPERAVLNIENDILATPAKLRPPHNFFVILNLFSEDRDEPETHTFKYP